MNHPARSRLKGKLSMAQLTPPVGPEDHAQGPDDAPVTLVEYGDYECLSCLQGHRLVTEVQRRMGDRLRFVFRNFPLTDIHPHAEAAAEAAEAAGAQGKFWEMHRRLFAHQRALDRAHLGQYAGELGLDVGRFERDLTGHASVARVQGDVAGGLRSGVQGTPTFYINGTQYEDSYDPETLTEALKRAACG